MPLPRLPFRGDDRAVRDLDVARDELARHDRRFDAQPHVGLPTPASPALTASHTSGASGVASFDMWPQAS